MSDPTIFGSNPNPAGDPSNQGTPAGATVQIDPAIITLLSEIKNERGEPKYKSLPDALVALKHSQEYIPTLTSQLSQKDTELAQARAAAERVAELERTVQALTQRTDPTPGTPPAAGLTPEQIAELVTRTLTQKEQAELAKKNTALVADTLKATFGTDAEAKYNAKAAELGMSVAEFNTLAARSPQAVLQMFGTKAPANPGSPTPTSVNTTGLQPHQDSFIGRNTETMAVGATTEDMRREQHRAARMVEELHAQGKTVSDLSNPKEFFKLFGKH